MSVVHPGKRFLFFSTSLCTIAFWFDIQIQHDPGNPEYTAVLSGETAAYRSALWVQPKPATSRTGE